MMNEKHPIDDLFQRGLNRHAVPPPMHIWERIEEVRGVKHRSKLVFWRQKFTIIAAAAAVLLMGVWFNWSPAPDLGSFPLAGQGAVAVNQNLALPLPQDPDTPVTQAGVVSDVPALVRNMVEAVAPLAVSVKAAAAPALDPGQGSGKTPEQITTNNTEPEHAPAVDEAVTGRSEQMLLPAILTGALDQILPSGLQQLDVAPIPVPETGCARFSEGRPAVFLALTAEPSIPIRRFAAKDEEYVSYAAQRAKTESVHFSYGGSARLSVVFPWGGAIRSGISYAQLNERLVYKNSRVRQTIITEIYGPNGDVIGRDTTNVTDTTILKYNNRYRLLDIPLQLGYEVRYNKVTVAANVGASLNVAFSQRGNYLGPLDLLPTRFDSDDPKAEAVYKTRVGVGFHASLGLHYQLNDRLDLMAEPYLRYYPQSFTLEEYPLSQKYLVGGLGVGLRVLL